MRGRRRLFLSEGKKGIIRVACTSQHNNRLSPTHYGGASMANAASNCLYQNITLITKTTLLFSKHKRTNKATTLKLSTGKTRSQGMIDQSERITVSNA